jgi:opacity protein-like surface antigen
MRRILSTAVAALAVVALSGSAYAAQATKEAKQEAKHATAKSMAATGKIAKYDESSKTVTLTTSKGDESFVLGDNAKVTHSGKAVTDLSTLVGHSAKVHYTEAGGTKTATSIAVAGMSAEKGAKKEKPSTE